MNLKEAMRDVTKVGPYSYSPDCCWVNTEHLLFIMDTIREVEKIFNDLAKLTRHVNVMNPESFGKSILAANIRDRLRHLGLGETNRSQSTAYPTGPYWGKR